MNTEAYKQGQADGELDVETRYSDEQQVQAERGAQDAAEAARVEVLSWPVEGWETGAQDAGAHAHSAAGRADRDAYYAGYDAGARAALAELRQPRRPLGLAAGTLQVPADFNAPLPAEMGRVCPHCGGRTMAPLAPVEYAPGRASLPLAPGGGGADYFGGPCSDACRAEVVAHMRDEDERAAELAAFRARSEQEWAVYRASLP